MRDRLRKLLPPSGAAYELFDCSTFLLALGYIGYVLTAPPPSQAVALRAPLVFITETQLGYLMIAAALAGVVTAYASGLTDGLRWLRVGYVATITMTLALSVNYALGWATTDASARSFLSALLYGWIARRLLSQQPPKAPKGPCRAG